MFASARNAFRMCADDFGSSNSFVESSIYCIEEKLHRAVGAFDQFDRYQRNCRDYYCLNWLCYSVRIHWLIVTAFFDSMASLQSTDRTAVIRSYFDLNQPPN